MGKQVEGIRSLASLALIESEYNLEGRRNDRVGLFMPLVLEFLQGCSGIEFDEAYVAEGLAAQAGLNLPVAVIRTLLKRCCKVRKAYLVRRDGKYRRTDEPIPQSNIAARKKGIESAHDELIGRMVAFAREQEGVEIGGDEARVLLAAYLDQHFGSLSIADVSLLGSSSDDARTKWVGRFIISLSENNDPLLSSVVTLVRGRVIYDAAFMPGFSSEQQRLANLVVYLDSPIVLSAMGYGTESDERLYREGIRLLRESGVVCRVLDETLEEMRRLMTAVADNWGSPRQNERLDSFVLMMPKRGYERSTARSVADDPESALKESGLGIRVDVAPERIADYVSDEMPLANRLMRDGGDLSEPRIWHDVNCIAAVISRWKGQQPRRLGDAKCLFATDSRPTILTIRKWWSDDMHGGMISPIISFTDLVNIAWMYGEPESSGAFSKDSLVSVCAAAMMPTDVVWTAFSVKIRTMVADNRMSAERARDLLFNSSVAHVLSEMEDYEVADGIDDAKLDLIVEKVDKRVADSVYGDELASKDAEILEAKRLNVETAGKLDASDKLLAETKGRAEKSERQVARVKKQIREAAKEKAHRIVWRTFAACVVATIAVAVFLVWTNSHHEAWNWVLAMVPAIIGSLGFPFKAEDKLAARIESGRMKELFGELDSGFDD